jgi:hypothetical protein
MAFRWVLIVLFALAAHGAEACSIHVTRHNYVNVVRLEGPEIPGLTWLRVHNMLSYQGAGPLLVSALRGGRRVPVARWDNGQACAFDAAGAEQCVKNNPESGVRLEGLFGRWTAMADRREALKRIDVTLYVETGGREFVLWLRSRPVRMNDELLGLFYNRGIQELCGYDDP